MVEHKEQQSLNNLVNSVQSGVSKSKEILYLYLKKECFPTIEKYILHKGGTREDAKDLFQDAVIILLEAIKVGKFSLRVVSFKSYSDQLGAYLMSIVKNLWKKELRWRSRKMEKTENSSHEAMSSDLASALISEEFELLSDDCQSILSLYFKDNLSPRVIAGRIGKKTEELKKQLTLCIDNLTKSIGHVLKKDHQQKLSELLDNGINDLEERCRTILTQFYYKKKSMGELADQLGYANAHVVTEQKNRCMKRLNKVIVKRLFDNEKT